MWRRPFIHQRRNSSRRKGEYTFLFNTNRYFTNLGVIPEGNETMRVHWWAPVQQSITVERQFLARVMNLSPCLFHDMKIGIKNSKSVSRMLAWSLYTPMKISDWGKIDLLSKFYLVSWGPCCIQWTWGAFWLKSYDFSPVLPPQHPPCQTSRYCIHSYFWPAAERMPPGNIAEGGKQFAASHLKRGWKQKEHRDAGWRLMNSSHSPWGRKRQLLSREKDLSRRLLTLPLCVFLLSSSWLLLASYVAWLLFLIPNDRSFYELFVAFSTQVASTSRQRVFVRMLGGQQQSLLVHYNSTVEAIGPWIEARKGSRTDIHIPSVSSQSLMLFHVHPI